MKTVVPEFSRMLRADRIPKLGSTEKMKADEKELKALAKRFDVPAMHALNANLRITPWRGGGLKVKGEVVVELDRESVVSLEVFTTRQAIQVERYLLPEGIDLPESEDDIDHIVNGEVDLGEIVAETFALELDPYPRAPKEDFTSGPEPEPEPAKVSPFKALSKLKSKD